MTKTFIYDISLYVDQLDVLKKYLSLIIPKSLLIRIKYKCPIDYVRSLLAWTILYMKLKKFNIDLNQCEICENEYHKPYVKNIDIYFNISHSENLVGVVISSEECGLDIQVVKKIPNEDKVALKILSEEELQIYEKSINKEDYLINIWSIKEAVFKKRGTGIVLSEFSRINDSVQTISLLDKIGNKYYVSISSIDEKIVKIRRLENDLPKMWQ